MNQRNHQIYLPPLLILLVLFSLAGASCKKFITVDPPVTKPDGSVVFKTDAAAISIMTGLYSTMSAGSGFSGVGSISVIAGLSADELRAYAAAGSQQLQAYSNSLKSTDAPFWGELYKYVYVTNETIEGVAASSALSAHVKRQLMGEAKFMRAFLYFYLVNLFGDVPLVTVTDYRITQNATRNPATDIYLQIVRDLQDAEELLADNYLAADLATNTEERVRPNKWAAKALLARVYLYMGEWAKAEQLAGQIIENTTLFNLKTDLNEVFLKNSTEAIWQLQPVNIGLNTEDGKTFVLIADPDGDHPVSVSNRLYTAFEPDDKRRTDWVGIFVGAQTYYFPHKYKVGPYDVNQPMNEYLMVLRLAEQYLIRAEARASAGNLEGARNDLEVIRERAGLPTKNITDKAALLSAIEQERRVELFSELGHRWLDLKRMKRADAVMSVVTPEKGGIWNSNWQLYPIPLEQTIQKTPNIKQNPGYQ
jgi:hypothetical protein